MKIIAWNCNMAYRKKAGYILSYKLDIAIISECEHPDKLKFIPGVRLPKDIYWAGDNLHKGIGIFSYSHYTFQLHKSYNPAFKNIIPLDVTAEETSFILLAIWANNPEDKQHQYIGQVWKALQHYQPLLLHEKIILAGDFNSNTIWDKPRREGNHSAVVNLLEDKKIFSSYHQFFKQQQGKERHNTLFLYRHIDKGYHLDYCFASAYFNDKLKSVKVGTHKKWCALSDHTPLTVQFEI